MCPALFAPLSLGRRETFKCKGTAKTPRLTWIERNARGHGTSLPSPKQPELRVSLSSTGQVFSLQLSKDRYTPKRERRGWRLKPRIIRFSSRKVNNKHVRSIVPNGALNEPRTTSKQCM